ncbi:MAG TPA: hypothetical protein VK988_14600 [Acidimicrobiales bacterium]|nr:hypothetical protein [Acidimicrobiales bacterium]
MSFVSKVIRIGAAVTTVGMSEATGVPQALAVAKRRSNDRHATNIMADAIAKANGEPTAAEKRKREADDRRLERQRNNQEQRKKRVSWN